MNIYKDNVVAVLTAVSTVVVGVTAWSYVAISFSSTTLKATFYKAALADAALGTGTEFATASTSAPSCTSLASNFIGKANNPDAVNEVNLPAALNDVKIYNTALGFDQLKANFLSEKSMLTYL